MDFDFSRGQYRRLYSGAIFGRRINRVSHLAERLFWRLVSACDDYGNHPWDLYLAQHQLVPLLRLSDAELVGAMQDLEREGLVRRYEWRGEHFAHVVGHLALQPADRSGRRVRRFPACPFEREDLEQEEVSAAPDPVPGAAEPAPSSGQPGNPGESWGILRSPGESCGTQGDPGDTRTITKTTTKTSSRQGPDDNNAHDNDNPAAAASSKKTGEGDKPGNASDADDLIGRLGQTAVSLPGDPGTPTGQRIVQDLRLTAAFITKAVSEHGLNKVVLAIDRAWTLAQRGPIANPAGLVAYLLKAGVSQPARPPPKARESSARSAVRRAVEAARIATCQQLGLPADFRPTSRSRYPQVTTADADRVQAAMAAAAKSERDRLAPDPGPTTVEGG